MKKLLFIFFALYSKSLFAQSELTPEKFGFRYFSIIYEKDTVNILVKSRKGEETKRKPIFFFCQGSLPVPLILLDEKGPFGTFPFTPDSITENYHLVIVGKPGTPVVASIKNLDKDFTCYEKQPGHFSKNYLVKNYLDYYVQRNKQVIRYIQKQPWVDKTKLVVAGHSEGSYIAACMSSSIKEVTHLIYSGGNPLGRMLTLITRSRENESDSLQFAEQNFDEWQKIIQDPENNATANNGDPYKTTFGFSISLVEKFEKMNIPVLVTYGTKDYGSAPFNDYLRLEMIRLKKRIFRSNLILEKNIIIFRLKKMEK